MRPSRFRPSFPGPRSNRAPLRRTHRLGCFGPPCGGRGGVQRTPLRRIHPFDCPVASTAGGRCLLCALLLNRVQIKLPRHVEVVQVSQTVVRLVHHPPTTSI